MQRDTAWLAKALTHEKRTRVLTEVWKRPVKGWPQVLAKVGAAIHMPEFYAKLLDAFQRSTERRLLCHWRRPISPLTLELLNSDGFSDLSPALLNTLNEDSAEALEVMRLTVAHVLADKKGPALQSLKRCRNLDQVERWYHRWLERTPFPAPPWTGDELLVPLDSAKRIREVAERFSNCLESRILSVHAGKRYYYADATFSSLVVELERGDFGTWYIGEVNGPNNKEPSQRLQRECRRRMLAAGVLPSAHRACAIW